MSEQRRVRSFEIGQHLFDRYEIFARYSGGMATVYGAVDVEGGRRYAVKTCRDHANQAALDEAFRQEIALGLELEPHPGVLRLRFADALGDQRFAFFDFIGGGGAGRTLRDHIDAGAVTTALLGDYALQISRALAFLGRTRSIAHLDLKPSNILVDGGRIQISDFGLSRSVAQFGADPAAAAGGTAGYMPPEQIGRSLVDERADIYAFAVILYEILTGAAPDVEAKTLYWQGLSRNVLQEPFRRDLTSGQVSDLWRMIGACIDPDAADRYQGFDVIVRALVKVFGDRPPRPLDAADSAAAVLRRARSWQVIGEHSQSLRALNRLLVAHPDCAEAFEAAKPADAALAAEHARRPPRTRSRAAKATPITPLPYDELVKLTSQFAREHRAATALRHMLAALAAAPRDKKLLELASVVARSGMSRGNHQLAAARGEQLDNELILDPLLDPIFCQCSYRATRQSTDDGSSQPGGDDRCRAFWLPLGMFAMGAARICVINMPGGVCPRCHNHCCNQHFAHSELDVESSIPVCPYDRTPLEAAIHPNGRGAMRIAKARHPVRLIRLLREGPLPPDPQYTAEALEALAPGALDDAPEIERCAVRDWSRAESRNDELLLACRPPAFKVETTHAVFEGDRICIARVLALRADAGDMRAPREPSTDDGARAPRSSPEGATLVAELEAALEAIRQARFRGAAGTSDPLRPGGVQVMTFSAAHENNFAIHRRLLQHLAGRGLLSGYQLFQLDLAGLDGHAGMLAVIGPSSAMRTFDRTTYYSADAEAFVGRTCGGDWKQVTSTSGAQDVPLPGCALHLGGAERSFVEVLSLVRAHASEITALRGG